MHACVISANECYVHLSFGDHTLAEIISPFMVSKGLETGYSPFTATGEIYAGNSINIFSINPLSINWKNQKLSILCRACNFLLKSCTQSRFTQEKEARVSFTRFPHASKLCGRNSLFVANTTVCLW